MCQTDAFYRELASRLGVVALNDERFATMTGRFEHKRELLEMLAAIFREQPVAHWLQLLEGGVPVAPVNDLAQALNDPQVAAQGLIRQFQHHHFGTVRQLAGPVRPSQPPPAPRRGPRLAEDSRAVLAELAGVSDEEFAALAAAGIVQGDKVRVDNLQDNSVQGHNVEGHNVE